MKIRVPLAVTALLSLSLAVMPGAASAVVAPNGLIAYTACEFAADLGRTTCDLWVVDPAAADPTPRNVTRTPEVDESDPNWSPDGSRLAFTRDIGACNTNIWVINPNGSGQRQVTYRDQPDTYACQLEPTWAPDGRELAFLRTNPDTSVLEIVVTDVDGGAERVVTPPEGPGASFGALELAWSPDGGKIAFSAVRDEMMEDPITGEPVDLRSPLPADLRQSLSVVSLMPELATHQDPLEVFGFYKTDEVLPGHKPDDHDDALE